MLYCGRLDSFARARVVELLRGRKLRKLVVVKGCQFLQNVSNSLCGKEKTYGSYYTSLMMCRPMNRLDCSPR